MMPPARPMPRYANQYFNRQLWIAEHPDQAALTGESWLLRLINRLSRRWPITVAAVVIGFGLVGFLVLITYEAWDRQFERFLDGFDWRGADRVGKFAVGSLLIAATLYLSMCLVSAWARGSFDRLVK